MSDQLLDRQQTGFQDSHDFWKRRTLNVRPEDRSLVACDRILIQTAFGVLIDAEQDHAASAPHRFESFRKQTASRVHDHVYAYSGCGFHRGGRVFGFWVYCRGGAEAFGRLSPKLGRFNDEDFPGSRAFEKHEEQQPNRARPENRHAFTGQEIGFFKRMPNAGERLGETRAFSRNIGTDLVQRFCGREVELGESAVAKDSERCHVLANIRESHSAILAQSAGDVGVDHHAIARLHVDNALADVRDRGYVFVTENASRRRGVTGRIGENMNISAADTHAIDAQQYVVCCLNTWAWKLFKRPMTWSVKNYRLHRFAHIQSPLGPAPKIEFVKCRFATKPPGH